MVASTAELTPGSPKSREPAQSATALITSCDPWPRPYHFEDGFRRVKPYHFTYNTYCKERWRGREILEVFVSEFRDRSMEYYKHAIETGHISLNGQPAPTIHTILRNGDIISHTIHRHEPPVTAKPIGVVHEDDGLIVIDKPAGVPVHPAGRYNYNSVVEIMRAERYHSFTPYPCNRLDRLTSGVMFIGKTKEAAEDMGRQLVERTIKKEYVARVKGRFPEEEVCCEEPILLISPKLGLNRVRPHGKTAKTMFTRLAYYGDDDDDDDDDSQRKRGSHHSKTASPIQGDDPQPSSSDGGTKQGYSIVTCSPLTGRSHQIRVHLQFLGFPIANDPIYCNQKVFGPALARGDNTPSNDANIVERLSRMGKSEVAEAVAYHDELVGRYEKAKAEKMTGEVCNICDTPLYSDPGPHEMGIYLHAKRYECQDGKWAYESALPDWALPPSNAKTDISTNDNKRPSEISE